MEAEGVGQGLVAGIGDRDREVEPRRAQARRHVEAEGEGVMLPGPGIVGQAQHHRVGGALHDVKGRSRAKPC